MKNFLVTGGAGFIGAHLVQALIEEGNNVVIVDNLKTKGGIPYVNPSATFINHDLTDPFVYQVLDQYSFDCVYHLAAQASGEDSYQNPDNDLKVNAYATWLIANYCKNKKIPRLIYMSTSAVYGSTGLEEVDEITPIKTDSIYGVTKLAGELFVDQLLRDSKTKYTMFRLTNAYGPGENLNFTKKGMVSIFTANVWRGEPIHVKGSLDRYRDFIFIEDIIDVLTCCLKKAQSFGETYLLSTGQKVTVRELIDSIKISMNVDSDYPVIAEGSTPGDTFGFHANINKIKKDLGWTPQYTIHRGLEKYAKWVLSIPITEDLTHYHPLWRKNNANRAVS